MQLCYPSTSCHRPARLQTSMAAVMLLAILRFCCCMSHRSCRAISSDLCDMRHDHGTQIKVSKTFSSKRSWRHLKIDRYSSCLMEIQPTQSINQSINQPINQSINQSTNQSMNQWINESMNQWINQSINQSINPSIYPFIHPSINQSINQSPLCKPNSWQYSIYINLYIHIYRFIV